MPRCDRTGPFGAGAMTGRGFGRGMGYMYRNPYPVNYGIEKDYLLAEKSSLENTLGAVNRQLEKINEELKKPGKTEGAE